MATPTRPLAVSTPKSHRPSTPNRPMASPRPGSSAVAQKSLAYKSPAVKTPASAHGHAHTVSVSSQPSSTPLAAATIHDELLALNSPAAALINSLAPTGMTPLSSGQDGLGISTQVQSGFSTSRDAQMPIDPEAQRLARLQQAMTALRSKAVGRGITRESVERVARLQGFEALWDEDNLTIAGNIVELEINFDPFIKDRIMDLALKFNSADGESHMQNRATDLLKREIGAGASPATEDLSPFASNVGYLAQMDRIDTSPNAFEVVGGLSQTLRSIWDEEKKRMSWRSTLYHARGGAIGDPHLDRRPKLGLCIDYWYNGPRAHEHQVGKVDMQDPAAFTVSVVCEAGAPGISASREWLTSDVLVAEPRSEDTIGENEQHYIPHWKDEATQSGMNLENDEKDQPTNEKLPAPPLGVHFSCELEPEVLLPHNVALRLNQDCPLSIDQSMAVTYQTALQKSRNASSSSNDAKTIDSRWSRGLSCLDTEGVITTKPHSYALYSSSQTSELWVVPITKLNFSHPRQLANAIAVMRQYTLVWSLLQTLVIHPLPKASPILVSSTDGRRKIKKRSNKDKITQSSNGLSVSTEQEPSSLPVDISLDLISDPANCKINIFAPLNHQSASSSGSSFLHLSLAVGPRGSIEVRELSGVGSSDSSGLKSKVAKMLEATEDIGIVVQWLLEQYEKSSRP